MSIKTEICEWLLNRSKRKRLNKNHEDIDYFMSQHEYHGQVLRENRECDAALIKYIKGSMLIPNPDNLRNAYYEGDKE